MKVIIRNSLGELESHDGITELIFRTKDKGIISLTHGLDYKIKYVNITYDENRHKTVTFTVFE